MALWGNNDAVGAGGTVSLDYATGVVTGSGTTFGNVGAAATGDVIRFGDRTTGVYYGDAVIVGIASTTQLTIGSTAGLSGVAVAGTTFTISELTVSSVSDNSFSQTNDADPSFVPITYVSGPMTTTVAIGSSIIPITGIQTGASGLLVGDSLINNGNNLVITSIGATAITVASTTGATITPGDALTFSRLSGGYSKDVYGVAGAGITASEDTVYDITHAGWVGVTTYMGSEGEMRVKTEVLVAMSGITTGNAPAYPPL